MTDDLWERLAGDEAWMDSIRTAADKVMGVITNAEMRKGVTIEPEASPVPPEDAELIAHFSGVLNVPDDVEVEDVMLKAIAIEMVRQEVERRMRGRR